MRNATQGNIGSGCFVSHLFITIKSGMITWSSIAGTVAYAAVPITARLTSIAARHIVSDIGSYYAVPRFLWLP